MQEVRTEKPSCEIGSEHVTLCVQLAWPSLIM